MFGYLFTFDGMLEQKYNLKWLHTCNTDKINVRDDTLVHLKQTADIQYKRKVSIQVVHKHFVVTT